MDTQDAIDIAKEFLDFLYIAKMTIVYDLYPSIDIEYIDQHYKLSLSYLENHNFFVFKNLNELFARITKFSSDKSIKRVHLTTGSTTSVIYGKLYNHEIPYANKDKIVRFT
jgi:hypothetical protein